MFQFNRTNIIIIFVILALFIFFQWSNSKQEGFQGWSLKPNMTWKVKGKKVEHETRPNCQNACKDKDKCSAFTFNESTNECYHRNTMPVKMYEEQNWFSGTKR